MVGAEHALGELGPGVLRLVGETGATDHADAGRVGITQGIGGRSESGGPAGGLKATIDTDHRGGETVLAVEGLEAEALLVGEPTPVDAVGVDTEQAQDLVAARLDGTREPTESIHAVEIVSSRSHGRALNRYGLAVSAPTGQICTVLPEKYEANGSSGNVLTWVLLPRSMKWISVSPATSSAKRCSDHRECSARGRGRRCR